MSEPLLKPVVDEFNNSSQDDLREDISLEDEGWIQNHNEKLAHASITRKYRKWFLLSGFLMTLVFVIGVAAYFAADKNLSIYIIADKNQSSDSPSTSATSTQTYFDSARFSDKLSSKPSKPRNVIMMISDGLGPASVTFARTYYQYTNNQPYDYQMPLDQIHVGQSRTRSASTLVTDSAAGATAFSCNMKTYNGAIGVSPEKMPCGTVLEAAKHQQHMLTGLVATSRITHATPASFSAHVEQRNQECAIARQQIGDNPLGRSLDLMFGGGYCHFLPKSSGRHESCRSDNRDLLKEAQEKYNWTTVMYKDKEAFEKLPLDENVLPAISLFSYDHMDYEIDRDNATQPSLSEMSKKALDILFKATENKEKGFFLLIEGSRIDMAAHSNDVATHVHEILEYQKTIELVMKYVDEHPDTIMISTSDHETGGLSLARQVTKKAPVYLWYPDVLTKVKSSTVNLAKEIKNQPQPPERDYIVSHILKDGLGITDPTDAELKTLLNDRLSQKRLDYYLADMVALRAQLGWSTHGHSGVDVNLYAYGTGAELLIGSHENIQVGEFITKALDLNLTDTTLQLNRDGPSFHLVSDMTTESKLAYNEYLDHYHEDIQANLKHTVFET